MAEVLEFALIAVLGVVAGVVNTLVGGGTYLTLPILMLLGLPAKVANATNRFSVFFQGLAGAGTLHRHGAGSIKEALPFAFASLVGAIPGAWIVVDLDEEVFRRIMGAVLLAGIGLMFVPRRESPAVDGEPLRRKVPGILVALLFGFHCGFLGAGVGVLIMLTFPRLLGITLLRCVVIKVLVVLGGSLAGAVVFVVSGLVDWKVAVPLIIGNATGGALGGRLAIKGGDRWLRYAVAGVGGSLAIAMVLGLRPGG